MINVTLHALHNSGPKQQDIARHAVELLVQALNHPAFEGRVATAYYRETRFRDAGGRSFSVTPAGVYQYIASGAERGTAPDAEIDLEVRLRKLRKGVVGSTVPGRLPFSTAYWFINGCLRDDDPVSLASHFIHEWLHVSGFYHYPNNKARQDVPYVVARIVREILKAQAFSVAAFGAQEGAALLFAEAAPLAPMEAALYTADCGAHEVNDSDGADDDEDPDPDDVQ